MPQLNVDCLNEIFEYLEHDKVTLYSCLLVNHLWCEVSVRIYWINIRNYSTLISCLPNKSKEILYYKNIITSSLASKLPTFNYASFCKILSIFEFNCELKQFLNKQQYISPRNLDIVSQEIFKFFMKISSIKKLDLNYLSGSNTITFTSYIGARDCLKDLSELHCSSDTCSQFFYQLSQICHNIQLFNITLTKDISKGLKDLISVQQNLKNLQILLPYDCDDDSIRDIITKISNTVIILYISGDNNKYIPLSFISKFINLQKLTIRILSYNKPPFEEFNELQYIKFSKLQYLELINVYPRNELLINFLKNNGRNLKEFYIKKSNKSINLTIIKYCPNLRKLFIGIRNDELETLKMFFESLEYLENIKIRCKGDFSERNLFDVIVKFSPKNFYKLVLHYSVDTRSTLLPIQLESFFINWANRESKKPLSLIICHDMNAHTFTENDENMKIIEKYTKLGVIRNFEIWDASNKLRN